MSALAQSVVERLEAYLATAFDPPLHVDEHPTVEHFPDNVERYDFCVARTTLLVGYERSTYGALESMAPYVQTRDRELGVTILTRSLRKPDGAIALIDLVRRALFGWHPPSGGSPLVVVRDEFVGEQQGVWRFVVLFRTSVPIVAEFAERSGPPFTSVGLRDHDDPRPEPEPDPEPEPEPEPEP